MTELTVGAGMAAGVVTYAVSRGARRAALLERAGLTATVLDHPDARILFPQFVALMRAAKALCQDPAFALHFGAAIDISEISIVGLMDYGIETVADVWDHINRYTSLMIETGGDASQRYVVRHHGRRVWIVDTRPNPDAFPELTESTFARIVCGWRRFAGDSRELRAVHVTHPAPAYRAAYETVFEVPVVFNSDCNALVWDVSWWRRRLSPDPPYVSHILSLHADRLLHELQQSKSMRGRVEALLLPRLRDGDTSMAAVAADLGLTRATLLRRLKVEGVTFARLLDELRCTVAIQYLRSGQYTVAETAYRVGFSDPAPFSRAVKRWTGRSPSAFAGAAQEEGEDPAPVGDTPASASLPPGMTT